MVKSLVRALSLLVILPVVAACNGGGGGAKASVEFQNQAEPVSFAPGDTSDPTVFGMKLIAAYLTEDIDPDTQNNVGQTAMVWLNQECNDDIRDCDISGGTNEDGNPFGNIVTTFFDFAQGSAAVNAQINAESRLLPPGTYRYARLEFCKFNQAAEPNIRYQGGTMPAPAEFQRGACSVSSEPFTAPLDLAEGDSAIVTLAYDYTGSITEGAGVGDHCDSGFCFTLPQFVPSASAP